MLKYLIILLDDTSVSYCHYENRKTERRLISLDDLKAGIVFAMKQNLTVQFVYPNYELPNEYKTAIETIDHTKICPASLKEENADVLCVENLKNIDANQNEILVCKISKEELFNSYEKLIPVLENVNRLNIVISDIDKFSETDFSTYKDILGKLVEKIKKQYANGRISQINILTDRILLDRMNNCNAGAESITFAPDGKFYVCPAFYFEDGNESVGNLTEGINIKNSQLYRLEYAPLCRKCDAFQCKRCVWLNRKTTHEINTPSHEQCVTAHLERNASRELLLELQRYFPDREIEKIDYLDPFEVRDKYKN
ncbi:MAG: CXXX repeat peptide maturase [Dysgonamonadaceae bacterium]|jgi:CXXX repeat peptide maturase|nr:CXXX repeat peptide maturase [Dysgonamonadaceae bacterium]